MLIDFLTERYTFTGANLGVSFLFYFLAGVIALLLRRLGQARVAKKQGYANPRFPALWIQDLTSSLWATCFFIITGCLKGPLREEDRPNAPTVRVKLFFSGLLFPLICAAGAFLCYTILEIFAEYTAVAYLMLFMKSLVCANLSLLIFSILPLPCSDAEQLLRKKEFGPKGIALRKQGMYPFLIFTTVGLLLGTVTVSMAGFAYSLSSIITLFPFFLIGG